MDSIKRLVILGVGVAAVVVVAGARPAGAQTKEARGTVTAVSDRTMSVKAGAQELTFVVDSETHLDVRTDARRVQSAQPGSPRPRVNDFFESGNTVLVRYREENGRNHALDISRVGSAGAGGGSVSQPAKVAEGKVTSISASQLAIDSGGHQFSFGITRDTDVLMRGATKATKAAGGNTPITTFVHPGDTVSVSYHDAGGTMTASEVRVRISQK